MSLSPCPPGSETGDTHLEDIGASPLSPRLNLLVYPSRAFHLRSSCHSSRIDLYRSRSVWQKRPLHDQPESKEIGEVGYDRVGGVGFRC